MNVFYRLYRRKSLLSSLLSRVSLFTVQLFAISSIYLTRLLCSSALYWQHAFAHYCGLSSEGYFHWRPWHKWGQGEICSGIVNLSYLRFSFRFPLFAFINCIYHLFPISPSFTLQFPRFLFLLLLLFHLFCFSAPC